MAFLINSTNSGLQNSSFSVALAAPLTFACWFKGASVTSFGRLMSATDTGTANNYWALFDRGDIAGDPVEWQVNAGGVVADARTTSGYSANTWTHALGVDIATNSREAYINAGSVDTDTTNHAPSGIDYFSIGMAKVSTGTFYSNHAVTMAEAVIFNRNLSSDEKAALAAGFSPLIVASSAVIHYWPLGGIYGDNYRDIVGGYDLTQVGTVTAAEHPRIIYPSGSGLVVPAAVAAATGNSERRIMRGVMRGTMRGAA